MSILNRGKPDYDGQIFALAQRLAVVEQKLSFILTAQAGYNARLSSVEGGVIVTPTPTPTPTHTLLAPQVVTATPDDNYSLAFDVTLPQDEALSDTGYMGFGLKAERATDAAFTVGLTQEVNLLNGTEISVGDSDFLITNGLTVGAPYYFRFGVIPPLGDTVNIASPATVVGPLTVPGNANSNLNPVITLSGDSYIGNTNPVDATAAPYSGFYVGYFIQQHSGRTWRNFAKGGQGLPYFDQQLPAILALKPYIHYDDQGRNDFMDAAIVNYSYTSEQQLFDAYTAKRKALWDQIVAQGTKLITNTLTERHAADNESYNQIYNRWRKTYNTWVRGLKASGYLYDVVDYGGNATVGADGGFQINSIPITSDGLHFYEPASDPTHGHGIAYSYFKPVFENALANIPLPGGSTGDDDVSSFAIGPSNVTHAEGNSGTTLFQYTITRTGGLAFPAAIDWAVTGSGSNPASASDFQGGVFPSGTANFAANAATATISVNVAGDSTVEPDETFTVTISNGRTNGTTTGPTATGTITNDDTSGGGGGGSAVAYTAGTPQYNMDQFAGTDTFSGINLPAGYPVFALVPDPDYMDSRYPASAKLTKSGQPDVILTKTGTVWWTSSSPIVAGSDWVLTAIAASPFVGLAMTPGVTAAAVSISENFSTFVGSGNDSPAVATTANTIGTGGLALHLTEADKSGSSPPSLTPNGATQAATVTGTSFSGAKVRVTMATTTASGKQSTGFDVGANVRLFSLTLAPAA